MCEYKRIAQIQVHKQHFVLPVLLPFLCHSNMLYKFIIFIKSNSECKFRIMYLTLFKCFVSYLS